MNSRQAQQALRLASRTQGKPQTLRKATRQPAPAAFAVESALPAPPAVSSPIPPESYSATAHWHISTWRSRLTATPPTSGSSSKDSRDEN